MNDFSSLGPHRPVESVASEARTLGDVLRRRARVTPSRAAHFTKAVDGVWRRTHWEGFLHAARNMAAGLIELGLEPGERVAILGPTRAEWAFQDFGAQLAGLVSVGVYPMQSPEQLRYLLEHSETRVIFVSGEAELTNVLEAARGLDSLRAIVPWEAEHLGIGGDERLLSPEHFSREAPPETEAEIERRLAGRSENDTAILIYTSGTTGPPKGAMISHGNILSLLRTDLIDFYQDDLLLSFLPMAHATERILAFYLRVANGVAAAYASSIGAVLEEVREVRPTVFGSVPRLFEKAYAKVRGEIAKKPAPVQALFGWAERTGKERLRYRLDGKNVPLAVRLRWRVAEKLVFRKIQAAFGGRVRFCISGAAPISYDILEFLWAAGLPIIEGYGMTEATVLTHVGRLETPKLGWIGPPIPILEQRLADDGELLIRGPIVFQGYFKNPEATAETVQDGWLHTGDIGELDAEGYLRITDRKKHLIITAGGKNVAPANIERAIKDESPLISQVHAHGDRRPFISAILAPSPLETLEWGVEHGVVSRDEYTARSTELMANPQARSAALNAAMAKVTAKKEFCELFLEPVRRGNAKLARVERVRRFTVLDRDFSQEGGELTPTMKTKRSTIEKLYAETLERIYTEQDFGWNTE